MNLRLHTFSIGLDQDSLCDIAFRLKVLLLYALFVASA